MTRLMEGAVVPELDTRDPPAGSDRRAFTRSALAGCKLRDVSNIPAVSVTLC